MSSETAAAGVAAVVAAICTVVCVRRLAATGWRRPPLIAWSVGFALFTIATVALWYGAAFGWTDAAFRIYYLTGGILVVAYLAVGELLLVLPGRRVTRMVAATMLFLTFAAVAAVLAARVDAAELAAAGAAPPNDALEGPWPKALAIALNSAGTAVLLVFSLRSAYQRRDFRPLLVAVGVAVIAVASTATRLGSYALFALAQAVGIVLILAGLVWRRPTPGRLAADDARGLRLLARCGVAMDRVVAGGAVDQRLQASMGRSRELRLAGVGLALEATVERLDLRAVAQILEPLPRGCPHPLRLLLGIRQDAPSRLHATPTRPVGERRDDSKASR